MSESEQEKRETLADIVEEMRRGTKLPGFWRSCDLNEILAYYAGRIEAALRREKSEIGADALAVGGIVEAARHKPGNAAAMREALIEMQDHADKKIGVTCNVSLLAEYGWFVQKINAALSAPARQYDVGTAEEQGERCMAQFDQWRRKGDGKKLIAAIMEWAQTPYAAEEGAGK